MTKIHSKFQILTYMYVLSPTEPFQEFTRSSDITTYSAIVAGKATTTPEASESGGTPVTTIARRVTTAPEADGSGRTTTAGRVTTNAETDESGGTPVTTITTAVFGGIIGVLVTIIVCICVCCIARYVNYNKERQQSDDSEQQQQQQHKQQQQKQDDTMNVVLMQQNEAYTEPTAYHTAAGIPDQALQLNQAYGLDTEETGNEYERMYAVNHHAIFSSNTRGLDLVKFEHSLREYELPVQQQESSICTEDNEHPYDYIL